MIQKTYAIGSGDYRPLRDYVLIIRDLNPLAPMGIGEVPSLSDKAFSSCDSTSELNKDTGFACSVSFEEGISRTIEWYKSENV